MALGLLGCGGGVSRYRAPDLATSVPDSVAVLPFDNESLSFAAPEILRGLVSAKLSSYGYAVMDNAEVDERLHALGVTDGGQLGAYTPQTLKESLGTDGLMYGNVEEFVYQNIGFFKKRKVRLRLKLVHGTRAMLLWEDVGEETWIEIALSKKAAGRSFIEGVLEQAAENLFKVPLRQESEQAVNQVLSKYPRRY